LNTRLLVSIFAAAFLFACGGGGDDGSGSSTPPPPTAFACSPTQPGSTAAAPDNNAPSNVGTPLPVGTLAHDGPATPEQISLVLPVTGALPDTATATVRYRQTGSGQWLAGHPLFRVRPAFSEIPQAGGAVQDVFAWPIIDVTPGASYDIEVAVRSGANVTVRSLTHTTRALPGPAGSANKTANSVVTIESQVAGLNAGDVLEIAAGTYDFPSGLLINRSGTLNSPIYIRGASRTGTIIRRTTGPFGPGFGSVIDIEASHIILENLTIQGTATDQGAGSFYTGIEIDTPGHTRITLRHLRILGVDLGINSWTETQQTLVYNNLLQGNNLWQISPTNYLESDITWNDEGIKLPGSGNVAFQNSISRFADSFAYASHNAGSENTAVGVHYYRNDIRNSGDDLFEADHAKRNNSFYDNRSHNSMNAGSFDPIYGGPFVHARNIIINPYRVTTHKWNSQNTGQFLYNNTIIGTVSRHFDADVASWYQPNNGDQRSYGYRNNVHVYRGNGQSIWLNSTGHDPIDWTHNSWFPNRLIQWPEGNFPDLADAQANLLNTTSIFSGTNRRMQNDNITVSNPWTTTITLGTDSLTEVTASYTPALAPGTSPKNSGVVIPNITDGFSGGAPDRGAIIQGRPIPQYGDCSDS
jgi:hypothetical protein